MTLRSEIEALLVEFDHFAYRGAPLDVAVEKLQEILDKTAPRVLTTVEELDSEEASKARCLIPNEGRDVFVLCDRTGAGKNLWVGAGGEHTYTSAELIEELSMGGEPSFTPVHDMDGSAVAAPKVLTTVEELDSEEASEALCLIPASGSGILGFYGRRDGQNEWTCMGSDNYFTSAELLADCANLGDEARFTLIERPDAPPAKPRVLTTLDELNSEEAFETLCIVPSGGLPRTAASRNNGINYWQKPGDSNEYSSAELLASFTETGMKPAFTMVDCSFPPVDRRVLTTEEELNSAEAFHALCIVPYGGPLRVAMRRNNGVNYWREPGWDGEQSSAELLAHFASIGAEPSFTVIEGE
jgi:hypothetical protein